MRRQKLTDFTMDYAEHTGLACKAPCSMYSVLLEHRLIDDPFYGDNEKRMRELSRRPCRFTSLFVVDEETASMPNLLLRFHGLDTLCTITLNGEVLARTDSMHRTYTYDVRERVRMGENTLVLDFEPPLPEIDKRQAEHFLCTDMNCYPGAAHLRKAFCMSGWDWAPTLPDMGIFRDIELIAFRHKIIENVVVRQEHGDGTVTLRLELETLGTDDMSRAVASLVSPAGNVYYCGFADGKGEITVRDPNLWWPNGLGLQNLYKLSVNLYSDSEIEDTKEMRIGLRTLTVSREKDDYGESFALTVNGVKFFAMGANYVPEDSLFPRHSKERTRRLLTDCKSANFNTVRVWGGAFYPHDYFYDLCDELGLVVWQDFMIACCNVWLKDEYKENYIAEFRDNFRRLAHHPSLGIVAGNNEMEWFVADEPTWAGEEVERDYLEFYEGILPRLAKQYIPDTFYWPASPSSGGGFDNPNDPTRGDCHYWGPWGGGVPFEDCRNHLFRFCSEFGFESIPSMKTVRTFAAEDDQNLFSAVMEDHQKKPGGTLMMIKYASEKYRYANSLSDFAYVSQLMQLDAMRYTVEHMRRHRGICMGAIYWQLNDCWPVASWASIDYFGRWKALHYGAKKFYAPVLVSAHEDGTRVTFNISNETKKPFDGSFTYSVVAADNTRVFRDSFPIKVDAMSALDVLSCDLSSVVKGHEHEYVVTYSISGGAESSGTLMFTPPKAFAFKKPSIRTEIFGEGSSYTLTIWSDVLAKGVELDFDDLDAVFEDNYFDITDTTPRRISFTTSEPTAAQELREKLRVRSVYDIGR